MPRKAKIPIERIKEILTLYKESLLTTEGIIKGPTNPIWFEIALNFGAGNMSPTYLYMLCKTNRYKLAGTLGLEKTADQERLPESVEESESSGSDLEDKLNFNLTLTQGEWKKIHPVPTIYHATDPNRPNRSQRNHFVFSSAEWTDMFALHFWEQTNLKCTIIFKRSHIHPQSKVNYITIDGYCKECLSDLKVTMDNEPSDQVERVILKCSYEGNFKTCQSSRKRPLKGQRRSTLVHKMVSEKLKPSTVRELEARKLMKFGDKEPSILPSANSLRTALYEERTRLELSEDPVVAIGILKTLSRYQDTIKDVGYDPFYVHYWSPMQMDLYKVYVKSSSEPTISIDATGGLVKKPRLISRPTEKSVFLYEITIQNPSVGLQCAISQMLSSQHDNISIYYWLSKWQRDGAPLPKVVVTDQSLALIYAVVRAFTPFATLDQYLTACHTTAVTGNDYSQLPHCFIRIDVAHTMKIFSSWPPLKHAVRRVKQFFLFSFAQVITSQSYGNVLSLLKDILTVLSSETEGMELTTNTPTACEIAKNRLKQQISLSAMNHACLFSEEENEPNTSDLVEIGDETLTTDINTNDTSSTFQRDIEHMAEQVQEIAIQEEGDRDNMMFLPGLKKYLINQCKYLPLWANFMTKDFGVNNKNASSSATESNFNHLKNRVFSSVSLPIRVDDFIEKHIDALEGILLLSAGNKSLGTVDLTMEVVEHAGELEQNQDCDTAEDAGAGDKSGNRSDLKAFRKPMISNRIVEPLNMTEIALEGWGPKRNNKKQSRYLHGSLYVDKQFSPVPHLKNGNMLGTVQFGKNKYRIQNTCGLDSLLQILVCGYTDDAQFRDWVNKHAKGHFWDLLISLAKKGANMVTYRKRARLAKDHSSVQCVKVSIGAGEVHRIDLASTIQSLIKTFLTGMSSYEVVMDCPECLDNEKKNIKVINLDVQTSANMSNEIAEGIRLHVESELNVCCNCGLSSQTVHFPSPIIFVEIMKKLTDSDFEEESGKTQRTMIVPQVKVRVGDIPTEIVILKESLKLLGAIVLSSGDMPAETAIGHYYAIAKRGNFYEIYDDMKSKSTRASNSKDYAVELLVYMFERKKK